jgi:hypothetical protein
MDSDCSTNKTIFFLRLEVFTVETMKNAVLWDVAPCESCKNRRFGGNLSPSEMTRARKCYTVANWQSVSNRLTLLQARCYFFYPEDEGDTFLRNVGFYKTHTMPHPRRWHSSIYFCLGTRIPTHIQPFIVQSNYYPDISWTWDVFGRVLTGLKPSN